MRENILAPKAAAVENIEREVEAESAHVESENSAVEAEEANVEPESENLEAENSIVEPDSAEIESEDAPIETADEPTIATAEVESAPASSKKKGRRIHDFDSLVELWPAVLMRIRKKIGVTAVAYLHDARPVGFSDEELVLEFSKEFHHAKATEASKRLPFEDKINETLDKPRRLRLQMAAPAPKVEIAPEIEEDDDDDGDLSGGGDIVEYAQNMFGAQIMGRSG